MKKPQVSDGFALVFALFLLWSWPLGLAGLTLWVLRILLGILGGLWRLLIGAWLLTALVRTFLLEWGARTSQQKDPPKENKNPYSFKEKAPAPAEGPTLVLPDPLPTEEEAPAAPAPAETVSLDEAVLEETLNRLEQELLPPRELHPESPGQTAQQGG